MSIKKMIKENNTLREHMNPTNKDYYEDIVVYVRSSGVDRTQSEQMLLKLAHEVLDAQHKGITARQLLGEDAEEYSRTQISTFAIQKTMTGFPYYVMIAWVALSLFFFMEAIVGFTVLWMKGSVSSFNQISLLTIIVIAVGSILLIESVTNLLNKGGEDGENKKPTINLMTIGIYVVIMVVILMIGYMIRNLLPVFTIQPWVSLIIASIGLLGWFILFKRRK
ncbi:DUF1129 family protein [Paenibacillus sp. CMAA1364]